MNYNANDILWNLYLERGENIQEWNKSGEELVKQSSAKEDMAHAEADDGEVFLYGGLYMDGSVVKLDPNTLKPIEKMTKKEWEKIHQDSRDIKLSQEDFDKIEEEAKKLQEKYLSSTDCEERERINDILKNISICLSANNHGNTDKYVMD